MHAGYIMLIFTWRKKIRIITTNENTMCHTVDCAKDEDESAKLYVTLTEQMPESTSLCCCRILLMYKYTLLIHVCVYLFVYIGGRVKFCG